MIHVATEVPHSIEAEQSVLGAILLDDTALIKARAVLEPADFYATAHQVIFRAMLNLADRESAIDTITLVDALQHEGALKAVGGAAYLAELVVAVASPDTAGQHAKIIAEQSTLRALRAQSIEVQRSVERGEGIEHLTSLVEEMQGRMLGPDTSRASRGSGFNPVSADDLLAKPIEEVSWVMEDYLPDGGLVILAGKPKEGKTTIAYELAVKVSQGLPFLGRQTAQGGVLILAVEEHRRDVLLRLRNLMPDGLERVFVHSGHLAPTAMAFAELETFIQKNDVRLVILDTLASFWRIQDENDAAAMARAVTPLLQLARESGACVLLIHHARKSDGQYCR